MTSNHLGISSVWRSLVATVGAKITFPYRNETTNVVRYYDVLKHRRSTVFDRNISRRSA